MSASPTHLVLIPSYNSGPILRTTVRDAVAVWEPVWVVDDGSTDGSAQDLGVFVARCARNGGKGNAVRAGLRLAMEAGYTHALVMDGDGQHPADKIAEFMEASRAQPEAMVLGRPIFGADAPRARVWGRRVANALARALTGIAADSLFGFRVYPIGPLLAVMGETPGMGGFDFDAEALVRLAWRGVPALILPTPVRYPGPEAGGLSHFRYGRDNRLLSAMFMRLAAESWRGRRGR